MARKKIVEAVEQNIDEEEVYIALQSSKLVFVVWLHDADGKPVYEYDSRNNRKPCFTQKAFKPMPIIQSDGKWSSEGCRGVFVLNKKDPDYKDVKKALDVLMANKQNQIYTKEDAEKVIDPEGYTARKEIEDKDNTIASLKRKMREVGFDPDEIK
jgi:hypothetical protein